MAEKKKKLRKPKVTAKGIIPGDRQEPEKRGKGRPKESYSVEIDWAVVDRLLSIQCTQVEIAGVMGCKTDTLFARCKADHGIAWKEYANPRMEAGKASLRRLQHKKAQSGDGRMLIFLGKNYLNQADKREVGGIGGGPIETKATVNMEKIPTDALQAIIDAAEESEDGEG